MQSFFRFRSGGDVIRGAFINSSSEACSIHESGRMVFNCLKGSDRYALDYFSLDMIDVPTLEQTGVVKRLDGQAVPERFDFWVFNWHFTTMAPYLDLDSISRLKGLKFDILLELEPGNPLVYVPQDIFDGYLALDPREMPGKVFAFPRPLEGQARVARPPRDVPVISSFGFGTPGKGFEMVVEAVNREFDEAIVRVNIPAGAYTGSCDGIHGEDYPRYLGRLCRSIAKKGIDVRFSHDFMTPDELIDWCGESDLNCFLYTRRQPGLSATTDQAIMSGQPMITGTNDTFRHIHSYIPPYPLMSLRQAINETGPIVRRLQQDWSRDTFARNFERILEMHGLGALKPYEPAPERRRTKQAAPTVLIATSRKRGRRSIMDYETRLADALGRSETYSIIVAPCTDDGEFEACLGGASPWAVICVDMPEQSPWPARFAARIDGPVIDMTTRAGASGAGIVSVERRPIVPYYTPASALPTDRKRIWLVGLSAMPSRLERIIARVAQEIGEAHIMIEVPEEAWTPFAGELQRLRGLPAAAGLHIDPQVTGRLNEHEIAVSFGAASLVVIANDPARTSELDDLVAIALVTERAVTFIRDADFPAYRGLGTYIDDRSLPELIADGVAGQIGIVAEFGEWQTYARIERLLAAHGGAVTGVSDISGAEQAAGLRWHAIAAQLPALLAIPAETSTVRLRHLLSLDESPLVEAAYQAILSRPADGDGLAHQLEKLTAGASRHTVLGGLFFSAENMLRLADRPRLVRRLQALIHMDEEGFLETAYTEILGRPADSGGLETARRQLEQGAPRSTLLGTLLFSEEAFQLAERRRQEASHRPLAIDGDPEAFIHAAYIRMLGRLADPDGLSHNLNAINHGLTAEELIGGLFLVPESIARMRALSTEATALTQVVEADGVDFIDAAFRSILGRAPASESIEDYLQKLEAGVSRPTILGDLILSAEGTNHLATLKDPPAGRSLDAIAWHELDRRSGQDFLHAAYWRLLGRSPDVHSFTPFLDRLNQGEQKSTIAGELITSPEGLVRTASIWPALGARLTDLLGRHGVDFVVTAYRLFTGRQPDVRLAAGIAEQIGSTVSKPALVGRLLLSFEGLDRMTRQRLDDDSNAVLLNAAKPLRLPAAPGERRIFLLIEASDRADVEIDDFSTALLQDLLAQGETLHVLRWSPTLRKFALLTRRSLAKLAGTHAGERCMAAHPGSDAATVYLDDAGVSRETWLVVPGAIRPEADLERLHEVDALLEARRLRLHAAFVFHGADQLRLTGGKHAAAEEIYMQSLLLGDVIVPTSLMAENDVCGFLTQHQGAGAVPLIRRIAGDDRTPGGRSTFARTLRELLSEATDPKATLVSIYLCLPGAPRTSVIGTAFATELAKGFDALGIAAIPCTWDAARQSIVGADTTVDDCRWAPWVDPGDTAAPRWIITTADNEVETLRALPAFAWREGFRLAGIGPELLGGDETREILTAMTDFDRVLAPSPEAFAQLQAFLLGWRGRLPLAEDRFKLLAVPNGGPQTTKRRQGRGKKHVLVIADAAARQELATLLPLLKGEGSSGYGDVSVSVIEPSGSHKETAAADGAEIGRQSLHNAPDGTDADLVVLLGHAHERRSVIRFCQTNGIPCLLGGSRFEDAIPFARNVDFRDRHAIAEALDIALGAGRLHEPVTVASLSQSGGLVAYAATIIHELLGAEPLENQHHVTRQPHRDIYRSLPHLSRRPKLSICISTYQRAGWVSLGLRNLFEQIGAPRSEIEVVVVDNASVDHTDAVVAPYLDRRDFRYVRNPENVGMLGNLAVTAQRARGEYVWILGDDDLTRPGAITRILQVLGAHPRIGLVYLNYGYSSEKDPGAVVDLRHYLNNFNILEPAGPDLLAPVRDIAACNENFFTAIYAIVYRRDHALRAYCQDTTGRTFSTMASCIPTAKYVLTSMMDELAFWFGDYAMVVNSNVSWADYGAMFDLEHLPRCWDMAERGGTPPDDVDIRRSNRLWLIEMMWRNLFENDIAGNGAYVDPARVLNRLKHLPHLDERIPRFREIYERAYDAGHQAALIPPDRLFAAFRADAAAGTKPAGSHLAA